MRHFKILFASFAFLASVAFAQEAEPNEATRPTPNTQPQATEESKPTAQASAEPPADAAEEEDIRVEDLPASTLNTRIGIQVSAIPLTIDPVGGSNLPALEYDQNPAPKLGIGADFSWIGAYLSFLSLEPNNVVKQYGSTHVLDLQLHTYLWNFGVDLYYQDFKGYYLKNSKEVFPGQYDDSTVLKRPDLRSFFIGGNILYILHPERMSLIATGSNTALQIRSGGSWILSTSYDEQELRSDSVLAPAGLETAYGALGNITRGRFKTLSFGGGYGYNWVPWRNWYAHGSLLVSLGPQIQRYSTQSMGDFSSTVLAAKANARLAFGYNGPHYFGGLQILADNTLFNEGERSISFVTANASLFFGVRSDLGFSL